MIEEDALDLLEEFDDTRALRTAPTASDLWLELLLHEPRGSTTDPRDAELTFQRLHAGGEPGAVTTALLLLTAWRWRRCVSHLLQRLIGSGLLDEAALDELAKLALFDDQARFVVPASMFDGPGLVLSDDDDCPAVDDAPDDSQELPLLILARGMEPPMRRWGAGHLLRRDPDLLDEVRERIGRLESRAAAAAMTGVLDAVEILPSEPAEAVLDKAVEWPHKSVRRLALQKLAARGQPERAARRAQADPDASIRAAAATFGGASTLF